MAFVMQVMSLADGRPCKLDGQFYVQWDTGEGDRKMEQQEFSRDINKAMRFASQTDAMEEWKRVSTILPIRPHDGQPNRPLTSLNVMLEPAPDA